MLRRVVWNVVGVGAGLALALVLLIAVEAFSAVVHPFPPGFGQTPGQTPEQQHAEVCAHVERYPAWVLAAVVPMWSLAAGLSTWLAARLGGPGAGWVLRLALFAAVLSNVAMLPYPGWFRVLAVLGVGLGTFWGGGSKSRSVLRESSGP